MSRARPLTGPDDPRHGRYTTYANHRCRCEACTDAWRIKTRDYYRRRYGYLPRDVRNAIRALEASARHGTESRYAYCKCDECRAAATAGRRRRRHAASKAAV